VNKYVMMYWSNKSSQTSKMGVVAVLTESVHC
jgi:hypothetical protein